MNMTMLEQNTEVLRRTSGKWVDKRLVLWWPRHHQVAELGLSGFLMSSSRRSGPRS
ncbi:hypothetical protein [Domibacillus iocasae]|uniref:hypothetical protein n=1 Tax=Domibacillus iocasae TaxID=1714016 RepID=UPI0014714E67|nr:hypothetical protein [Domibacillus iocasae]